MMMWMMMRMYVCGLMFHDQCESECDYNKNDVITYVKLTTMIAIMTGLIQVALMVMMNNNSHELMIIKKLV